MLSWTSWINKTSLFLVRKFRYMRFDDLIKILLGGICRLRRVVSPWSDRHPSYLYFLYTRVGELKVHLLLLHSSVLNRVELGYLVMLLNQMKCSNYKIYWNVFVNIEPLKCNEHQVWMLMWHRVRRSPTSRSTTPRRSPTTPTSSTAILYSE